MVKLMRDSAVGARALLFAGLGFSWLVFYAGWLAFEPGGEEVTRLFADTAYLLPLASATVLSFYAWRTVPDALRPFWGFMTAACTAWLAADTAWCTRDLINGAVPYPWWSDLGYIASYLLLFGAVYSAFRPRFRTVGTIRLLDGALIVGTIAVAWWWILIRPIEVAATLRSVTDLAYPASALLLLGLLVTVRLLPSRHGTLAMWVVAAGVAAGVVADAAYVYSSEHGGYLTGAWIELLWQAQGVLFSLAALAAVGGLGRPPDWMTFREWPRLTPGVLASIVLGTGSVLITFDAREGGVSDGLFAGVALLSTVLAVRMWLALAPKREATADPETGAYAGYFDDRLQRQIARGRHFAEPFAVALAWADDADVSAKGDALSRAVRKVDTLSYLGDGRFGILLSGVEEAEAREFVEQLREDVSEVERTYSLGVSWWSPGMATEDLMDEAHRAMEWACRLGGNQVRLATTVTQDDWRELVALAELVEQREALPDGHSKQVATLAAAVARQLGLNDYRSQLSEAGGYLHDIGKVGIPTDVLRKSQMLDPEEWKAIKRHPDHGAAIVGRFGTLPEIAPIVAAHHERWDGAGYPRGLAAEEIPIEARVVAVANTVVAMTTDRAHRPALSETNALTAIWQQSGQAYDPSVVRALLALSSEGKLPRMHPTPARGHPAPRSVAAGAMA